MNMFWESLWEILQKAGQVLLSGVQIHTGILWMKASGWPWLATAITCSITSGIAVSLLYWSPEEMNWSRGTKNRIGGAIKQFFVRLLGQHLFDVITLGTVDWDDRLIRWILRARDWLLHKAVVKKYGEWICYAAAICPIPFTVQFAVVVLRVKGAPRIRGYFTILAINSIKAMALVLTLYEGMPRLLGWLLRLFGA
ncbi:MAG: hypothetical protein ABIB97_04140 [Patescibacteria group bacterium]